MEGMAKAKSSSAFRSILGRHGAPALRREGSLQTVQSASRFLSLSNNLGNLLFARRVTRMAISDKVWDTVLIVPGSRWVRPLDASLLTIQRAV